MRRLVPLAAGFCLAALVPIVIATAKPTTTKKSDFVLRHRAAQHYLETLKRHDPGFVRRWNEHLQLLRDAGHRVDEQELGVVVHRNARHSKTGLIARLFDSARNVLVATVHAEVEYCGEPWEYPDGIVPNGCSWNDADGYGAIAPYYDVSSMGDDDNNVYFADYLSFDDPYGDSWEVGDDFGVNWDSDLTVDDLLSNDPDIQRQAQEKYRAFYVDNWLFRTLTGDAQPNPNKTYGTYNCATQQRQIETVIDTTNIKDGIKAGVAGGVVGGVMANVPGAVVGLVVGGASAYDASVIAEYSHFICVCYYSCNSTAPRP